MNYTRRSLIGLTTAAGLLLCAILASTPVSALPLLESLPTLSTLHSRLELTPEQESKLAPLFDKRIAELRHSKELLAEARRKSESKTNSTRDDHPQ